MSLTNVDTGKTVPVQFNPVDPVVTLEAFWNRLKVGGATFEELQFTNTGNTQVSFKLQYDGKSEGAPDLDAVQAALLAFLYPPGLVSAVTGGAPSRILFAWPKWISIVSAAPKLTISPKRFDPSGAPDYLEVAVELHERRSSRLGSERVGALGLRRPA